MIQVADSEQPRLRIALGSTAFENIHRALASRQDDLLAQKALTLSGIAHERLARTADDVFPGGHGR